MAITIDTTGQYTIGIDYSRYATTKDLTALLQGYVGQVNSEKTRTQILYTINNYIADSAACGYNITNNQEFVYRPEDVTGNITFGNVGHIPNYIVSNSGTTDQSLFNTTIHVTGGTTEYVYNNLAGGWVWGGEESYVATSNKDYERERKRQNIRSRLVSVVKTRSEAIRGNTPEECLAMETLREVVTEDEFKRYLRYGFVLVRGRSGATYQVFRNRSHVKVWVGGKVIEEICVYLKDTADHGGSGKIPMTDKVIAFKAMIETDEESFKTLGNRYRMAA